MITVRHNASFSQRGKETNLPRWMQLLEKGETKGIARPLIIRSRSQKWKKKEKERKKEGREKRERTEGKELEREREREFHTVGQRKMSATPYISTRSYRADVENKGEWEGNAGAKIKIKPRNKRENRERRRRRRRGKKGAVDEKDKVDERKGRRFSSFDVVRSWKFRSVGAGVSSSNWSRVILLRFVDKPSYLSSV